MLVFGEFAHQQASCSPARDADEFYMKCMPEPLRRGLFIVKWKAKQLDNCWQLIIVQLDDVSMFCRVSKNLRRIERLPEIYVEDPRGLRPDGFQKREDRLAGLRRSLRQRTEAHRVRLLWRCLP